MRGGLRRREAEPGEGAAGKQPVTIMGMLSTLAILGVMAGGILRTSVDRR
jgi:hypothetical protein